MFERVFDLGFGRRPSQAFGFYLIHFIVGLISTVAIVVVVGLLFGMPQTQSESYRLGARVGAVVAVCYSLLLSAGVARDRKLPRSAKTIIPIILGGLLAAVGGLLLGLIPAAFLSSRPSPNEPEAPPEPSAPPRIGTP